MHGRACLPGVTRRFPARECRSSFPSAAWCTRFNFWGARVAAAALWLVLAVGVSGAQAAPDDVPSPLPIRVAGAIRGVWIPSPDHTEFFKSPAEMSRHLTELAGAGINSIFVVMWNQGRTFYPSRTMAALTGIGIDERFKGRDPLREVIDAARPHDMKVFAWFEFGFATSVGGGRGREILETRPQWTARGRDGEPLVKNGFRWMNALDPEVQDFMLALLMEVVVEYDLAGIQGDDRLPALPAEGGYDPGTIARYRAAHGGREPPTNRQQREWTSWVQWRADELSNFMRRIHTETRRRKPALIVAMAPSVFPWSREEYLQDWPTWVRNGWVDIVSPQLYRRNLPAYRSLLRAVTGSQVGDSQRAKVVPGVLLDVGGDYRASDAFIAQMVEANRREGVSGEVYFYNEGVRRRLDTFRRLYMGVATDIRATTPTRDVAPSP